ncbi:MAG: RloB family protein [Methylobacteriaceae bacterium]|jgi:hypothetical protein|nr:RloB family protein [Methylobacteriaceae bacterium]
MPRGRRKLRRPLGERPYRKLFLIAVEGVKTERQYFAVFNQLPPVIRVICPKSGHDSSPPQVLMRKKKHLREKEEELKSSDEAWLVVDKDEWTDEQLAQLHAWAQTCNNYHFALSNPKFEYWLLLHFEDSTGGISSRECSARLKHHLADYDKGIDPRRFTRARIDDAIRRARGRDTPSCPDWPRAPGSTTVYRLVDNILKA